MILATVDIMDEEGEMQLPVTDTRHIKYDIVGSHLKNYDLMINLAHFKGHAVALDKACLDLVFNHQSVAGDDASPLIRRIESLHGTHTVEYAEQLGLGSQQYTLVDLDLQTGVKSTEPESSNLYNVYSLDGKKLLTNARRLDGLEKGTYIVNGEKRIIE